MDRNPDQFLWVESYRPNTIAECILPADLKETFHAIVEKGEIPNLLLSGSAGIGKTTVARALCNEMGLAYLFINASEQNGIDVLRTTIRDFASTVSLSGSIKVVILDEADNLSAAMQQALRGFIEEFSKNCRFIFTANYKNKLIPAIHSRTTVIDFKVDKTEKPKMAAQMFRRACAILDNENVPYEKKAVAELINRYFPDFRRPINELQRHAAKGSIGEEILAKTSPETYRELSSALREKDFKRARSWVVNNSDIESHVLIRQIYDNMVPEVNEPAQLILILADCQKHLPWVADQEIHLAACMLEIMATCSFR